MTGDLPETLPDPEAPDEGASPGGQSRVPGDHRLDASAHAHLLEEPLPPDAATETAIIYNVTLASPHPDGDPAAASGSAEPPGPVHGAGTVRRTSALGSGAGHATSRPEPSSGVAPDLPDDAPGPRPARIPAPAPQIPTARKAGAAAAVVLVIALAILAGYLWISATEWRDQAGSYERTAVSLGEDLATTRNQLAGSQAELEAVRAQLSTAHERIVQLADEKNQALDDWELTQQVVDYQQRISEAAGTVALALDQCVQGQQELIGFLQQQVDPSPGPSPTPYDPAVVEEFQTQVEALCQEASEANIALQLELAR